MSALKNYSVRLTFYQLGVECTFLDTAEADHPIDAILSANAAFEETYPTIDFSNLKIQCEELTP